MQNPQEVIKKAINEQHGFLTMDDIRVLAINRKTRYIECLVRCGCGRFITSADSVEHFTNIIEREGTDYIRDISFLADFVAEYRKARV